MALNIKPQFEILQHKVTKYRVWRFKRKNNGNEISEKMSSRPKSGPPFNKQEFRHQHQTLKVNQSP